MADPEQIYQEVLSEEQGKGVTPAVAEARAKSARARAEHGSPHPKEPKWWPGAQPHFEGGGGEAPAEAEEAPAEEPAEEPAAEAPAEEATADVQAPEVEPDAPAAAPEPATEEPVAPAAAGTPAPAPQAVPQEPAVVQPAAAAAQPAATQTVIPQTTGVSHGTTTGTRLRPEDEVSTEAQFEGQKAMYERRKLIDDLVASGVPQVTAHDTDRPRSPALAILYLLIPLLAIFLITSNDDGSEATADAGTEATATEGGGGEDGGGGGDSSTLVAANIQWDTDTLTFKAGEPAQLTLDNEDSTVHNMSIYEDEASAESQSDPLFKGDDVDPGASADYQIDPLDKGTYTFICDYHINMIGDVEVQ